jgi:hypothetical protein
MRFVDAEGNEVVLVAAGGGSFFPGPASDALVAFRLPRRAGTARAGK